MEFKELEKLMDKLSNTPISESDKNDIAKLGAEVKENGMKVENYKDLVKFTKSIEKLLWISGNIHSKVISDRGYYKRRLE
ncbi:hypothetical protein [Lactococcus sp. LG606]|uniref:hypothetical protein n=1 Tax=Lactococcus sp. LG606 TaxID=2816912 RepID=UPI001A90496D|nr:hypothetical protein [Lactococcus sp. LG606]QSR13141.1 hypothetical protein J0J35_01800 [Lactococcus sp. LG606]